MHRSADLRPLAGIASDRQAAGVSKPSHRVQRIVGRDFAAPSDLDDVYRLLTAVSDSERVQAAIVLATGGDMAEIRRGVDLASVDWRDLLVNGGLAGADWEARLDTELAAS